MPITGLTVLVLVPAIVFDSLARAALPRDLLSRLAIHVALQLAGVWLLTAVVARLVGWRGPAQGAFLLATLFANSANIGLRWRSSRSGRTGSPSREAGSR